jgi:catecholate siderophore receptor
LFAAHVLLATTAAAFAPSATDYDGGADAPPLVVVTGERDKRVRSATKTDTPLKDVPQAVSVVTKERIDDQGMRSITDVLRAVPGASVASGEGHRDAIILRGQNSTADFFVDGIRDDVQYYRGLYNLDRVEVLKGPNAMIFGRGGGGGVVNRVTKKAHGRTGAGAILSLDSHGAWVGAVDLEAALTPQGPGRVNAV